MFSQHARAEAADFEVTGVDNVELADWIHRELEWDQLILEFYTPGEPNSGWIHCSVTEGMPRKQFLHAYREEGRTKYKPIIGKAKDIFVKKYQSKHNTSLIHNPIRITTPGLKSILLTPLPLFE